MASIYKSEAGRQKIMAEYQNILAAWPVANKQYKIPTSQGETFIIESGYEKKHRGSQGHHNFGSLGTKGGGVG